MPWRQEAGEVFGYLNALVRRQATEDFHSRRGWRALHALAEPSGMRPPRDAVQNIASEIHTLVKGFKSVDEHHSKSSYMTVVHCSDNLTVIGRFTVMWNKEIWGFSAISLNFWLTLE